MNWKEDLTYESLQAEYRSIGVVVDICGFFLPETFENSADIHADVLFEGMSVFKRRYEARWKSINPGISMDGYFQIQIWDTPKPTGQEVDFQTFLGDSFDWGTKLVDLYDYGTGYKSNKWEEKGLVYALLDPPYSLTLPYANGPFTPDYGDIERPALTAFLLRFLREVLAIDDIHQTDHLEIWEWSDDWTNYFDAGKEGWGTFCWTIWNHKHNRLIFLAASATD